MGAGYPYATGPIASNAAPNSRRGHGGQASGPGLFGLPGNGSLFRRNPAGKAAPAPQGQADDPAQRVGGLTFRQRSARRPQVVAPVASASTAARPAVTMEELMAKRRQLAAAAESDLREAFPYALDADEAAECGVSLLCAAELVLAQD